MLQRTPLFPLHQALGARLVGFGGWEMPVQYTSIVDEHLAVRRAAGLFDISHMGEIVVNGPGAADFLNRTLTNDIRKLAEGQGQYSLLCNDRGGVVDDLYVYRLKSDDFLLIVNASRIATDWDWLQTQVDRTPARDGFQLRNASSDFGAVAVQGPAVERFVNAAIPGGSISGTLAPHVTDLARNQVGTFIFQGVPVQVARTGYTGEDGFEIVAPADVIGAVWDALLVAGKSFALAPAGLGARDTLRTEMGYPLYGHELDEATTPIEAGLGFFVAFDKGDFVGRDVLVAEKAHGVRKRCVAFKMTEKAAPPRPGYLIYAESEQAAVGQVASGTQSPSLRIGIGMGYVRPEFAKPGTAIEVEIRGRRWPAVTAKKPLYQRLAERVARAKPD